MVPVASTTDKGGTNSSTAGEESLVTTGSDDATIPQSGSKNSHAVSSGGGSQPSSSLRRKKKRVVPDMSSMSVEEQLVFVREQVEQEKAGKRKLFHSLVKVASELRRVRDESEPLLEQRDYADKNWYDGGIWRAPTVLPGVFAQSFRTSRLRESISLKDLFFGLTIVTAYTRVGVAISKEGFVDVNSLLYFAVFWSVSGKEASYSTRFDTTDLSAQAVTLVTCFAVLFASLSVQQPINSIDGTRVMVMAAFVAALHILLYARVLVAEHWSGDGGDDNDADKDEDNNSHTRKYRTATSFGSTEVLAEIKKEYRPKVRTFSIFSLGMCLCELLVWIVGIFAVPSDWPHRWIIFLGGILLAFRVPRSFLPSDFHVSCSKRGVLFTLLLGFLLQSIIVVASEFFTYQTPQFENYCFIGAACLMLFCIKLLYVDDSDVLAEDHAYMINPMAAFFFNVGQFSLMLSTTVLGSGLNLLTHDYLSATQALMGPSKSMVCGGYAAVLLSTFFFKSLHLKRVPTDRWGQFLFITAYLIQALTLLAVASVAAVMAWGNVSGLLAVLLQSDILLLVALSCATFVVVIMHWLDEGVELALYGSAEEGRSYRVHPFGFWWCVKHNEASFAVQDTSENSLFEGGAGSSGSTGILGPHEDLSVSASSTDLAGYLGLSKSTLGGSLTFRPRTLSIVSPLLGRSDDPAAGGGGIGYQSTMTAPTSQPTGSVIGAGEFV